MQLGISRFVINGFGLLRNVELYGLENSKVFLFGNSKIGSNELGKTTFLRAIEWAIAGFLPAQRYIPNPSFNRDSRIVAEIDLRTEAGLIQIERQTTPNNVKIRLNGHSIEEDQLWRLLGVSSKKAFHTAATLFQNDPRLTDITAPAERLKLFSELVDLDLLDKLEELSKKVFNTRLEELSNLKSKIERIESSMSSFSEDEKKEVDQFLSEVDATLLELETIYSRESSEIRSELDAVVTDFDRINTNIKSTSKQLEETKAKLTVLERILKVFRSEVICPTCNQDLQGEKAASILIEKSEEQELIKNKLKDLEEKLAGLREKFIKVSERRSQLEKLELKVGSDYKIKVSEIKTKKELYEGRKNSMQNKETESSVKLSVLQVQRPSLERRVNLLKIARDSGIKLLKRKYISSLLNGIVEESNNSLHKVGLVDWNIQLTDDLELVWVEPGSRIKKHPTQWSDGVKALTTLSLHLSLSNVLNANKAGIWLLNEPWSNMSDMLKSYGENLLPVHGTILIDDNSNEFPMIPLPEGNIVLEFIKTAEGTSINQH